VSHVVTGGVTESSCKLFHPVLQNDMTPEQHPLMAHLKETGESLTGFAKRAGLSRMQLYRIMNGEPTTTASFDKINAATNGKITMMTFAKLERVG